MKKVVPESQKSTKGDYYDENDEDEKNKDKMLDETMHLFQNLNDAKDMKLKKDNKIEIHDSYEIDENNNAQENLFVDPANVNFDNQEFT